MGLTLRTTMIPVAKRLYQETGVPLDRLPYTDVFEKMLGAFTRETKLILTLREFYTELLKLRKFGQLGKLNRKDRT